MEISQAEADRLITMDKKRCDTKTYTFPAPGMHVEIPLVSTDDSTEFIVNLYHAIIKRNKIQGAELFERNVPLIRMCIGGKGHENPHIEAPLAKFSGLEGIDLGENHVHYYVEGYGTSWGYPITISSSLFYPLSQIAYYFLDLCHVVDRPVIMGGL